MLSIVISILVALVAGPLAGVVTFLAIEATCFVIGLISMLW